MKFHMENMYKFMYSMEISIYQLSIAQIRITELLRTITTIVCSLNKDPNIDISNI